MSDVRIRNTNKNTKLITSKRAAEDAVLSREAAILDIVIRQIPKMINFYLNNIIAREKTYIHLEKAISKDLVYFMRCIQQCLILRDEQPFIDLLDELSIIFSKHEYNQVSKKDLSRYYGVFLKNITEQIKRRSRIYRTRSVPYSLRYQHSLRYQRIGRNTIFYLSKLSVSIKKILDV